MAEPLDRTIEQPEPADYDVVVIGGALSGGSVALLLKREMPELRVLVVEKSVQFGRRVGEATVEVSAYFLMRVLGLGQHLHNSHIAKHGLRFWFANEETTTLADCSEIGGRYLSRVPSFQVDRAVLDEEVLKRAGDAGASILRPASVRRVSLKSGGFQEIDLAIEGVARVIRSRWVIDASGVACLLARQEGWWRQNSAHPTSALWARYRNVADLDGLDLAAKYPKWRKECFGLRSTATNHMMGRGWWAWFIPLKGGDTSVGVVFDQRLVQMPEGGSLSQRLTEFLSKHPVSRELLANAEVEAGDVHWRKNLPYSTTVQAGDGFVLVGDAAGFLDPFYSPGMDWISFTALSAVQLVLKERRGACIAAAVPEHNRLFTMSYHRWFEALYQDKYQYLGDFELMSLAFSLDLGLYYLGVVGQPYNRGIEAFLEPLFSTPVSTPFYKFMRFYNRRFARIAEARVRINTFGRCNAHHKKLVKGFELSPVAAIPVLRALAAWICLELREGWRSWRFLEGKHVPQELKRKPIQPVVHSPSN
jgi:flavin-dependent dehydrogenase